MGRAERLVESVAPQRDRVGRRGVRGPRRAELPDLELLAERLDVVLELQLLPRLDAERTDAQPTWAQEGGVERGAGGCPRRRDVSRDGGNPAVPDGAAGAGQRRSGSAATAARRAVPEARAGALRRGARVPHRRAAGPGGARRGGGIAAARAHRGASREAAAVPADRRIGAGGPRDGAAHRHVQCSDPDLAVERPAPDGRAAEPLAQAAAGPRAARGVGGEGGFLELGSVGGAVGRLVRVYAEAV